MVEQRDAGFTRRHEKQEECKVNVRNPVRRWTWKREITLRTQEDGVLHPKLCPPNRMQGLTIFHASLGRYRYHDTFNTPNCWRRGLPITNNRVSREDVWYQWPFRPPTQSFGQGKSLFHSTIAQRASVEALLTFLRVSHTYSLSTFSDNRIS